jgi:hypothetical protein
MGAIGVIPSIIKVWQHHIDCKCANMSRAAAFQGACRQLCFVPNDHCSAKSVVLQDACVLRNIRQLQWHPMAQHANGTALHNAPGP